MMRNVLNQLRRIGAKIGDLFFPKNCLHCNAEGVWLCESCRDSLFFIAAGFCPFCGEHADLHGVCKKCRERTGVFKVFSLWKYGDPLAQKLVKGLKYRYLKEIAGELEPVWRKFFLKYKNLLNIEQGTVLLPVPLHWYRKCDRGFNQAEELANVIGRILELPVLDGLVFKKHTL